MRGSGDSRGRRKEKGQGNRELGDRTQPNADMALARACPASKTSCSAANPQGEQKRIGRGESGKRSRSRRMPAPFRNQEHLLIGQEQKAPDSQEHLEPRIETARARDKHRDRRGREEPVVLPRRRVWSSESARGRRKAWLAGWLLPWNSHFLSLFLEERARRGSSGGREALYMCGKTNCAAPRRRDGGCDCARGGNGDGLPGPLPIIRTPNLYGWPCATSTWETRLAFGGKFCLGRINVFQGKASKILRELCFFWKGDMRENLFG